MGGGQLVVVGMLLSTSRAGELVTCRPGHVPSKVGEVVWWGEWVRAASVKVTWVHSKSLNDKTVFYKGYSEYTVFKWGCKTKQNALVMIW